MSGLSLVPALDLSSARPGDLVTLSFSDPEASVFGQARIALMPDGTRQTAVSVFLGSETVTAAVVPGDALTVSELAAERWSTHFAGTAGGAGAFALELRAIAPSAALGDPEFADDSPGAQQPAVAVGTVDADGQQRPLSGRAQIGLVRGGADWSRRGRWREIDCWLDQDETITVRASRPLGAREHGAEHVSAVLIGGEPRVSCPLDEARVSTIYDAEGRARQAGLELWASVDSDYPRRVAGQALCGATVSLAPPRGGDELNWTCTFLRWHMDGREGVGPYSVVAPRAS